MPNYVSNRISLKFADDPDEDKWKEEEEAREALKTLMKTDDSLFDFNVLIPYPSDWAKADDAHEAARDAWLALPAAQRGPYPSVADGYNHGGYEWCIEHWGTKWNAGDIGFDYDSILFETAWATPLPIWEAISKRFPTMQLTVEYADEDEGRNCGILVYSNGECVSQVSEHELCDAKLFARAIRAEQSGANHWYDLNQAQKRIKELEAKLASSVSTESEVS